MVATRSEISQRLEESDWIIWDQSDPAGPFLAPWDQSQINFNDM